MRRLPVYYGQIILKGGDYDGWEAKMRLNPPASVIDGLSDPKRVYASCAAMTSEWDFGDEEGNPIPCNEEGMGMLPMDLLSQLITAWAEERKLPPTTAGS
jgi:hypothetical protein